VISVRVPGHSWWESGEDVVVAWHSLQMPAIFIRCMILPIAMMGNISNIWKPDGPPPKENWHLCHDEIVTL
jgi:hypothetical protein